MMCDLSSLCCGGQENAEGFLRVAPGASDKESKGTTKTIPFSLSAHTHSAHTHSLPNNKNRK